MSSPITTTGTPTTTTASVSSPLAPAGSAGPGVSAMTTTSAETTTTMTTGTSSSGFPPTTTPFSTPIGTTGAPHSTPLPSCLMPESFTGSGDFEDYLQQFNTAAFLSGWYSTTHDSRPQYFALRLRQNALHFFTTLSVAQQTDCTLLVDAFRQNYTTNVDILKARLKTARQQPNQDIASFLCDVRTLARRAYRAFPHLIEQIVLTSFIEDLSDSTLRWELRKSKPATADEALTMAIELNSFLELEKGARSTFTVAPESAVNQVSRTSPEIQTNDLMDTFVRTLTEKLNKALPHSGKTQDSNTYKTQNSRSSSVESNGNKSVRFQTSNTWNTNNQHKRQHRGRSPELRKTNKNNSNREPCKHCKRNNHDSRDCKACFKCGRVGHFRNECRSNLNNNLN